MTRWDKILIGLLMLTSLLLILPILMNRPEARTAAVTVGNEEKLRLDLSQNGTWSVDGRLGPVTIQVQDGAVRVSQENSPHHYCSRQGWVKDAAIPIVCLPNETVVKIEGGGSQEDTVIQ